MIRHVQLGVVIGASLTRASVSIERITVQNFNDTNTQLWLGVYTTTIGNDGKATTPTNGQVPIIEGALTSSWESAELFNSQSPFVPGPVWVGLSSTENSYTATAITARIDVDYDEVEVAPSGLQTAFSASTNKLSVWANASAPQALYDVFVTDLNANGGVPLYLQLFAQDIANVINGVVSLQQWPLSLSGSAIGFNTPTGGQTYLNFGRTSTTGSGKLPGGGLQVYQTNALISATTQKAGGTATAANAYQGCVLAISTTSGVLTLANVASVYITARYTLNS